MYRYVIVYDIVSNKIRKKVSDILEGYGSRVNKSVFECTFSTKKEFKKLKSEIAQEIDPKIDSVRFYAICKNCLNDSTALSQNEEDPFVIESVYFT